MSKLKRDQMGSTRREILEILKKKGSMAVNELSQVLEITQMGVRGHLASLERDGLVGCRTVKKKVGRPTQVYSLTQEAHDLFPKSYHLFANGLLKDIKAIEGEAKIDLIFTARENRLYEERTPRMKGKDLEGRVAELTKIVDEVGYLADWEKVDDDTFIIKEHNCAIHCIAKDYPQACKHEHSLFLRLLDADVARTHHQLSGDHYCGYTIRRRKENG